MKNRTDRACSFGDGRRESALSLMLREGTIEEAALPYEKFSRLGADALTDAELLAIIIRTGSGKLTPMQIGAEILKKGGARERGLANLYHLSVEELMTIPGIGRVKATKLKCITELSRRMAETRSRPQLTFSDARSVAGYYMERLRHEDRERVLLLSLNGRMRLISENVITIGTVNRTLISPREIFMEALKCGAVNIIVLHNHPGGDPTPSGMDFSATDALAEAGKLLNIHLADHLIIGDGCYYSFRDHGYIDDGK